MEANALEKSMNKNITSRIFTRTYSMFRQIVRICGGVIFPKNILIIFKNFPNILFDAVE